MRETLTYENFRRTGIGLVVLSFVPVVPTILGFYTRNVISITIWENPPADTLLEYWALGALVVLMSVLVAVVIYLTLLLATVVGESIESFIQSRYG